MVIGSKPLNFVNLELGDIENVIDKFIDDGCKGDFSMLSWLHGHTIKRKDASGYGAIYKSLLDELDKALNGDEYYKNSYGYMTKPQLKRFFKFVNSIIEDCKKYCGRFKKKFFFNKQS